MLLLCWVLQFSKRVSVESEGLFGFSASVIEGHLGNVLVPWMNQYKVKEGILEAANIETALMRQGINPPPMRAAGADTHSRISAGWESSSSPEMMMPFSFTLPVKLKKTETLNLFTAVFNQHLKQRYKETLLEQKKSSSCHVLRKVDYEKEQPESALNNKRNVTHRKKVQAQHHFILTGCWTAALHLRRFPRTGRKKACRWCVNSPLFILLYISIPLKSAVRYFTFYPSAFIWPHGWNKRRWTVGEEHRAMSLHQADTPEKCPGERLCAAVTLSRSFRWSHGLNTSFPSPSLLSFRHCSFSRSIRRYSPYSRPLSAGSCSPSHPQPCPCPWPCPDMT